jgi:hypothetical protein
VSVTCYWLEPADLAEVGLRRYSPSAGNLADSCPREGGKWGYHGALSVLTDVPVIWSAERPDGCGQWFSDDDTRFGVPDGWTGCTAGRTTAAW